jgi:serine/threonine protein kinase
MRSDIWSMACILIELYTGEMFFATHENNEHLSLMEKQFGPFPYWMANKASPSFRDCFNLNMSDEEARQRGMRLKWPKIAKNRQSIKTHDTMNSLDVRALTLYLV